MMNTEFIITQNALHFLRAFHRYNRNSKNKTYSYRSQCWHADAAGASLGAYFREMERLQKVELIF